MNKIGFVLVDVTGHLTVQYEQESKASKQAATIVRKTRAERTSKGDRIARKSFIGFGTAPYSVSKKSKLAASRLVAV